MLGEAERSLHDALCVIRCLVNKRFLIAGGASSEMEINLTLSNWAKSLGVSMCVFYVCTRVRALLCMCVCVRFCVCVCMYVCMYVYMYVPISYPKERGEGDTTVSKT